MKFKQQRIQLDLPKGTYVVVLREGPGLPLSLGDQVVFRMTGKKMSPMYLTTTFICWRLWFIWHRRKVLKPHAMYAVAPTGLLQEHELRRIVQKMGDVPWSGAGPAQQNPQDAMI